MASNSVTKLASWTPGRYIVAAASNQDSQVISDGPADLGFISIGGVRTSALYLKLYNKATSPTSADTPVFVIFMPASGGNTMNFGGGLRFSAGISFRVTTGSADNDANAATAGDAVVSYGYKG